MRTLAVLSCSILIGLAFAACGGKVDVEDRVGDAGVDGAPTGTPTGTATGTPTSTPPGTGTAPAPTGTTPSDPRCPTTRPVRNVPCFTGLECNYGCGPGETREIRATCPSGRWVITDTAVCGGPVDSGVPADAEPPTCEACINDACAKERNACQASAACIERVKCASSCSNPECLNACRSKHPSAEGDTFIACIFNKCPSVCG